GPRSGRPALASPRRAIQRPRRRSYALTLSPPAAASILAMSVFFLSILASKARLDFVLSGSVVSSISTRGVICQEKPHLSLHQPHMLSSPPFLVMASQ